MFVTLDVSKLGDWLNEDAPCRVERRACDGLRCGPEGAGATAWGSGRRKSGAHAEDSTEGLGGRARAECTANM